MASHDHPPQRLDTSKLGGAFVVADSSWREKIFFGGLLMLLVHPLGWPASLGYRKALIARLQSGGTPMLPEWRGAIWTHFIEGVKALGVIFGYLSPLYGVLLGVLLLHGYSPNLNWVLAAFLFCCFPIFSTLSFPLMILFWACVAEPSPISSSLAAGLLFAFALIVFLIPAGFLQVSLTGRYLSAFNLCSAARTLVRYFRAYVCAWYRSMWLSLVGHFALPFAPWGVIWCYLGIIYEFNSILDREMSQRGEGRSWYQRLSEDESLVVRKSPIPFVYQCMNAADAAQTPCFLLSIGPVVVPLPTCIAKMIRFNRIVE